MWMLKSTSMITGALTWTLMSMAPVKHKTFFLQDSYTCDNTLSEILLISVSTGHSSVIKSSWFSLLKEIKPASVSPTNTEHSSWHWARTELSQVFTMKFLRRCLKDDLVFCSSLLLCVQWCKKELIDKMHVDWTYQVTINVWISSV